MSENFRRGRNLKKEDLGGVIFSCTKSTMEECLQKELFGLPASHISYVKNVEPGLPVFLFNASNRLIYGIFEATSHGQMSIDEFAWTESGEGKTKFPAQVRIRMKRQCLPLQEQRYYRVLKRNYPNSENFWFELDQEQTSNLIALFEPLTGELSWLVEFRVAEPHNSRTSDYLYPPNVELAPSKALEENAKATKENEDSNEKTGVEKPTAMNSAGIKKTGRGTDTKCTSGAKKKPERNPTMSHLDDNPSPAKAKRLSLEAGISSAREKTQTGISRVLSLSTKREEQYYCSSCETLDGRSTDVYIYRGGKSFQRYKIICGKCGKEWTVEPGEGHGR